MNRLRIGAIGPAHCNFRCNHDGAIRVQILVPSALAPYDRPIENRPKPVAARPQRPQTLRKWVLAAVVLLCLVLVLAASVWPFRRVSVVQNLEEASDSNLRMRSFRRTYFPSPGCVLEGVEFYHGANHNQPLITVDRVIIRGSYIGILSRRLSRIDAQNLHIFIAPFGSGETFKTTPSTITIDEIVANGAVLDFALEDPGKPPLRFEIHEASLRDVGWSGPLSYRIRLRSPEPPGEIAASGKFGVWNRSDPGQTPVSGEYQFDHADLSVYEGIAGLLSSTGKFGGTLAHIDIAGTTDIPDFEVRSGRHPVRLASQFTAFVDATHGDTFLKRVDAYFSRTHVVAEGSVAKSATGPGKTALIDLQSRQGRIEDILLLFAKAQRAPMSGSVSLRAKVEIPTGKQPFLEKVKLKGAFGVGAGSFSPDTQESVDKLSAGARGEKDGTDPETVLTDLTGQVTLEGGSARFSDLSFGVPGASARLHGIYSLVNHKIDLHGDMRVDTKISNTTSGGKAFLLNMMNPFFKKKRTGEVLKVRISGTYEHPSFGLDLHGKAAK